MLETQTDFKLFQIVLAPWSETGLVTLDEDMDDPVPFCIPDTVLVLFLN